MDLQRRKTENSSLLFPNLKAFFVNELWKYWKYSNGELEKLF